MDIVVHKDAVVRWCRTVGRSITSAWIDMSV